MSKYDDDFWSDDENESTGEAELGGGSFEVIPKNTKCRAHIEEIEWKYFDPNGDNIQYINARWNVESPSDYENRKVFHKIKLYGDDQSSKYYKADKQDKKIENARTMFWAIDKNCGGKLAALKRKPKNEDLQRFLIAKPMYITLDVTENGSNNWVRKIEPLNCGNAQSQPKPVPQKQAPKPQSKSNDYGNDFEDDPLPF